jgi:hypothetical protein
MFGTIAWMIAVVVGVIGLGVAFAMNARNLKRDLNQRRDAARASLENEANAVVDHLFRSAPPDPTRLPADK